MKKIIVLVTLSIMFIFFYTGKSVDAYTLSLYDRTDMDYNNSYLYTKLDSDIDVTMGTVFTSYKAKYTGRANTAWLGSTPYNADHVSMENKIWFYGTGGLTISGAIDPDGPSLGVELSFTSNSVKWEFDEDNNWRISHDYAGIQGKRWIMTSSGQSVTATYKFGTAYKTVQANDDKIIW